MKHALIIIGLVIILATIVLLIPRKANDATSTPVAATIFPIYDITLNVVGDTMDVGLILPAGASPHTYDPTPSTLRDLAGAEVVYAIGYGFDDWINTVIESVGAEKVLVDDGITLLDQQSSHSHSDSHGETASDPHYWLTVENAKLITQTIAGDLSNRFPEHADTFTNNASAYLSQLNQLDQNITNALAEVNNQNMVTLHDAWFYFAEEYGLEIVGTFEPTAGREPTPQYLVELTHAIEEAGTTVLYSEPQLATDSIESFLTDNNLSIAVLDPLGGVDDRQTYIDLMLYNAQTISQNQ
ncbi:MAG: metal ABC transporter substrate-binding protein [bacterium]